MLAYRYHRFSSKAQDTGSSLERQQHATGAYCREQGWSIVETLEDLGRSAWKGDHLRVGNLGRLKARIEGGEIGPGSVLVVENIDRLSRENVKKARRWVEEVTEAGVQIAVCSPTRKVFTEASLSGENIIELLTYLLEAQRSREESNRKSALLSGMWTRHREGARNGRIFTSRCPGWLQVVGTGADRRFEPIPERVEVVRQIYQWAAEGLGVIAICKRLNERGVKPWGKNFYKNAPDMFAARYVRDILESPAVEGEYHPKQQGKKTGERIQDYYPRVVDAEAVQTARGAIALRKGTGTYNREEAANLFIGKLVCGDCSRPMVRTVGRNKYGQRFEYLRCSKHRQGGNCTNKHHFRYDLFEKAALERILALALDNTHFTRPDAAKSIVAALADVQKAIENKKAEQQRLLQFVARNPDASEVEPLLNRLRPELAELEKQREELQHQLDAAMGSVTPEEHLQRVMQVSAAITSDDPEVRTGARRLVRDAVYGIVDRVRCTTRPEKRIEMSLAAGRIGFQFDDKGKLLQRFDLGDSAAHQQGFKGLAEDQWANIKRRRRTAGVKDGVVV